MHVHPIVYVGTEIVDMFNIYDRRGGVDKCRFLGEYKYFIMEKSFVSKHPYLH